MRYTLFFVYMLGLGPALFAQTVEQKVAGEVCVCLGEVVEKEEVEGKINKCLPAALAKVLDEGTEKEKNSLSTVGGVQRAMLQAKELLAENCAVVRLVVLKNKKNTYYIPSPIQKANGYYAVGMERLGQASYLKAIRKFKKALKADEKFVMAMDQLAMAYQEMGAYDEAIGWYESSLAIFPEGDVALLNIAVAYALKNDLEKSLEYYRRLTYLYPENPQGFYGVAKVLLLTGQYENALENILLAHKIYERQGADNIRESQKIITDLYHTFMELNKSDAFFAKTEQFGVEISLNEK